MLSAVRVCRAVSLSQPRWVASSGSSLMSASWVCNASVNSAPGTGLSQFSQMFAYGHASAAGAVAVGYPGLEHLGAEPGDLVRNDRPASRSEGEMVAHLAHGRLVRGP